VIWYRHWLELRRPLALLLALAVVAGFFFAENLGDEVGRLSVGDEPLRRGIARDFGPLLSVMTPTQTVALAMHAQSTVYLVLLAVLVLAGNGLHIMDVSDGGWGGGATLPVRAAPYTLSLPLSRARLIVTRVAAGYAAGVLFFALSLLVHRLVISAAGHDVPLLPMIMISVFASVMMVFWSTMLGMLTWMFGAGFGLFLTLIVALFSSIAVFKGMAGVTLGHRGLWDVLPLLLVVTTCVIYLTTRVVAREEF